MSLLSRARRKLDRLRLGRTARQVLEDRLSYLAPVKMRRIERALSQLRRRRVPGDFVEFGVALGGSAIVIARQAAGERRFLGLDVFEMIPPPASDKDDAKSQQRYETIRSGKSAGIRGDRYYGYRENLFEEVRQSFARYGVPVDGDGVQLYKGLFEETWPKVGARAIAFAHIDCDWYDPVRFCLGAVADLVSPGGILVIDDYHDYGGCRTAVDEFLGERRDFAFEPGANPYLRKIGA
ncbi:MAG TPA: TylF/MycF/NovP-related O-methyltransferase [Allosphingosinicella sp.]|nr:TylF/MycF/NovP-related O-methyltransferase [Allosphingosinicella sp.]